MDDSRMTRKMQDALEPGERPTLKTISRITGLAVATVSRALHDAPDIGQDTKRRVQETAHAIGYRPNRAGVRLRTGKTNVISLVLSTEHDLMNHTARLISSIAGALRKTPYHLIVTPYFPDEDPMTPIRYIVETQSADAVILNQIEPEDPRIAYLMEHNFPFAAHGRSKWADQHPYYDFDNAEFARQAIHTLAARGRKKVIAIAPPRHQNYGANTIAGLMRGKEETGLGVRVLEDISSDAPSGMVEPLIAAELAAYPNIDAVFCGSPNSAMATCAAIEGAGRTIGADIDLYSKEAIPFLRLFRAGILATSENITEAGAFLARAAMARIANPASPPMQYLEVPAGLVNDTDS